MSTDAPPSLSPDVGRDVAQEAEENVGSETREFPRPPSHGSAVMNTLADVDEEYANTHERPRLGERGTLYERAIAYYRENIGGPEVEPFVAVDDFSAEWLPSGRYALLVSSSRWKAGRGEGDDYRAVYQQHIKLREVAADGSFRKPPLALHVEVMPQFEDLVYKSGDALQCPHGEGTRVVAWTTWAGSGEAVETRAYDALQAVYGDDALDVGANGVPVGRVEESRRIAKAEAHVRHHVDTKNAVIDTVEDSKELIAWGGESEIDAASKRAAQGWVEAKVDSDRWDLLGFDDTNYSTEVKVYHTNDWHKRGESDPFRHPKLEASFAGVDRGELPHVDDWEEVHEHLRRVVATHAAWADVGRGDLVADDFFDGPEAPPMKYEHPVGRRDMLRRRYESRETTIYKEALKETTEAVYDILQTIALEAGATYDTLVERTGLARSTVRYHCRRLEAEGVVERIGNPVLVVFGSLDLLDRAREVLKRAKPGDAQEDMNERAEERRERREEERADNAREEGQENDDEAGDAQEADRADWRYLDEIVAEFVDVGYAYTSGEVGDRDIRVNRDALPGRLRG